MKRFALVLPMCVATVLLLSTPLYASEKKEEHDTIKLLELFGDVFEKVRKEYVEEPDDAELIEAAINGMLVSLDPHSSYLNRKDFEEMQVQTKGQFGGLGIEVTMEKGLVKIVAPLEDTPADKAGLQSGDLISQIDEEAVMGMTLSDAVEKMRGKVGTVIKLTILREELKEPLEVEIKRAIIKIKSVRGEAKQDVVYARINSFSEQTSPTLRKVVKKQMDELGEGVKGMVLDLRNNPGGLLDQAIEVSDMFLERGEIVSTRGRHESDTKRFNAKSGDLLEGKPIVVLINGGSASASEIVAGALQDHHRAIVLGTKSFGKGSVQTVIPLPEDSAMRVTTSRYYTPSGTSIQAKGIEPDILVEPAKVELIKAKGRMDESSLKGHLKNTDSKKDEKDTGESSESLYEKDYQLARAIDLLRALSMYQTALSETGLAKR